MENYFNKPVWRVSCWLFGEAGVRSGNVPGHCVQQSMQVGCAAAPEILLVIKPVAVEKLPGKKFVEIKSRQDALQTIFAGYMDIFYPPN